jgi:Family of unknown function (DUF6483)
MIRRDFILRQIEEFAATLAHIVGFAKNEQWQEASTTIAQTAQRLTGVELQELVGLSETELLARLIQSEPTVTVEAKTFMLVTLLKTQGDLLVGQGRGEESRAYYLKGLHLLFEVFGHTEPADRPDFVPTVQIFLVALGDAPLPLMTNAMLMQHYERLGEFARAEDALFEILDAEPGKIELLEFGRLFYERLLRLNDPALNAGNLPRTEVLSALAELEERKTNFSRGGDGLTRGTN